MINLKKVYRTGGILSLKVHMYFKNLREKKGFSVGIFWYLFINKKKAKCI